MNQKQASSKARALYGDNAHVRFTNYIHKPEQRYAIGRVDFGMFFLVLGSGESWTAAFNDAATKFNSTANAA